MNELALAIYFKFKSLFDRLPPPNRKWFWLAVVLGIRVPLLLFYILEGHRIVPDKMINFIVLQENDYVMLLGPIDTYFETGSYEFINGQQFAGRMPGYWLPYYFLRLIFSKGIAIQALILIQITLSVISCYFLALIARKIVCSDIAFYITLFIYSSLLCYLRFDFSTLSESASISLFIIGTYFLFSKISHYNNSDLLLIGFCFTWCFFLRPFLGYLLIPVGLVILSELVNQYKIKIWLFKMILFCLPFIFAEGAWIARNYLVLDRFIPFETSITQSYGRMYPKCFIAIRNLAGSFDVERADFEPGLCHWFRRSNDMEANQYIMPEKWFEGLSYGRAELEELRADYRAYRSSTNIDEYQLMDEDITLRARAMELEFKSQNALKYHVINRILNIKRRIFTSGSSYMSFLKFNDMNVLEKILKLLTSSLYYLIWIGGVFGCIFGVLNNKDSERKKFWWFSSFHIIALPIILAIINATLVNSYIATLIPLLMIGSIYFLSVLKQKLLSEN